MALSRAPDPAKLQAGDEGLGPNDTHPGLGSGSGSAFGKTGSGRQEYSIGFRGTAFGMGGEGVVGSDGGGLDVTSLVLVRCCLLLGEIDGAEYTCEAIANNVPEECQVVKHLFFCRTSDMSGCLYMFATFTRQRPRSHGP